MIVRGITCMRRWRIKMCSFEMVKGDNNGQFAVVIDRIVLWGAFQYQCTVVVTFSGQHRTGHIHVSSWRVSH